MVDEVGRWRWRWSGRFNRYGLLEERSFTHYRKFQLGSADYQKSDKMSRKPNVQDAKASSKMFK